MESFHHSNLEPNVDYLLPYNSARYSDATTLTASTIVLRHHNFLVYRHIVGSSDIVDFRSSRKHLCTLSPSTLLGLVRG
jgi:hypothetical protein